MKERYTGKLVWYVADSMELYKTYIMDLLSKVGVGGEFTYDN